MATSFFRKGKQVKTAIALVMTLVLAAGPLYGDTNELPPPVPAQEQPEILTRGPVHEAFAEPVDLQVQAGVVAPKPAAIQHSRKIRRQTNRQANNSSGCRATGPGIRNGTATSGSAAAGALRHQAGTGCQVTGPKCPKAGSGYPVSGRRLPALSRLSICRLLRRSKTCSRRGPSPSPDNIWVPPCWYWYQGRYVLRHGYWLVAQADWVWAPSHYVWTPRGYVFVAGELGLLAGAPGRVVCAGLFIKECL